MVPEPKIPEVETAVEAAIAACEGDTRAAVRALLIANTYLEAELAAVQAQLSRGFTRGKVKFSTTSKIGMQE